MSNWPSITALAEDVKSSKVTASELVDRSLKAIDAAKEYAAIIQTIEERARARAAEIDEKIKNGEPVGKLAGIPFIAKDNILTFGSETTAASNILKGFNAPYQSTAIELIEKEGGICVAKANLDAFGHGSSTENSDFMVTKNPHDKTKVPGGSSGGSVAGVVLEMAPFALGTDTGGSIRQPSSLSGAVGYKPTYGLVSRSGVIAMASSLDTVGPIARNVDDVAVILDIIAGRDQLDSTTIEREDSYVCSDSSVSGKKVGVIKEYMGDGVDEGVKQTILTAVDKLKQVGAEVNEVSVPSIALALACYYIICPAEISSNLSRYDGQKYGYSAEDAQTLDETYLLSRTRGFGSEAKRRIMIGTYVLSSGYYDAYYRRAQKVRTKLIKEFEAAFETVDFLVGPVSPTTAFPIGQNTSDPLKMYLTDIMTVSASLVGIPSISIPAGLSENLPVGFQVMAPQRKDKSLLDFAKAAEEVIK